MAKGILEAINVEISSIPLDMSVYGNPYNLKNIVFFMWCRTNYVIKLKIGLEIMERGKMDRTC